MSGNVRERDIQRFLQELEQGIRDINREHINALIPALTRETILSLESSVARLRARSLEAVCGIQGAAGGKSPDPATVAVLREKREAFEEVRKAHEALLYAVGRGYVDISELKSGE
jgi:hypothetical protein